MAPKKNTAEGAPSWLTPVLKRRDEYFERFDKMFEFSVKMQESQLAVTKELDAIEARFASESQKGSDPRSALYSALVKFKADTKLLDAKACRITWVDISEQSTESATYAFDKEAVKEVVETFSDELLLNEFKSGRITFHRHPKLKKTASGPRPRRMKIYLDTQELRDRMHMRTGRQSLTRNYVRSCATTDYTRGIGVRPIAAQRSRHNEQSRRCVGSYIF